MLLGYDPIHKLHRRMSASRLNDNTVPTSGVEPKLRDSKSPVLPLHHVGKSGTCWNRTNSSCFSGNRFYQVSLSTIEPCELLENSLFSLTRRALHHISIQGIVQKTGFAPAITLLPREITTLNGSLLYMKKPCTYGRAIR